jgi:glycerate-2-kinase
VNSRDRLEAILSAALRAVDAGSAVSRALRPPSPGMPLSIAGDPLAPDARLVVLALGKAACRMALRVEDLAAERIAAGLVITKDGHALDLRVLPVREAGHPVPDARGEAAARAALALAASASSGDCLLVLLSGGTSALTSCPAPGLDLGDLAATTRVLLACGADIHEMNAVRKHLSCFAGGQLARAARAGRIEVLAVSDVPGDALDVIGSGPCAPDPTTHADALAVLRRHGIEQAVPAGVLERLRQGASGSIPDTPSPGDPLFDRVRHTIVARNADARGAAVAEAVARGLEAVDLGEVLAGEAREQAAQLVARVRSTPGGRPRCFVAGGETTVTLRGPGQGGRNQEFALAAALALDETGDEGITLLAAGSDGSDGPTSAAGAFADAGSVARGARAGIDAKAALAANDSWGFFAREGGHLTTGPTGTNVMDLVLIEAR